MLFVSLVTAVLLLLQLDRGPLPASFAEFLELTFRGPKVLPGLRPLLPVEPHRRRASVALLTVAGKNCALSAWHSERKSRENMVCRQEKKGISTVRRKGYHFDLFCLPLMLHILRDERCPKK